MTAVLAAAPAVAFATQALLGTTPFVAAMAGLVAVAFFQAGLALLWARDLERSATALERGLHGRPPAAEPWLPGLGPLVHGGESRLRRLTARAASAEATLRAEAAIIEALPNPLLVLGADHQLRRTNAAARRELGTGILQLLRHPTLR